MKNEKLLPQIKPPATKLFMAVIIAITLFAVFLFLSENLRKKAERDICRIYCAPLESVLKDAGKGKTTCACIMPGREVTLEELYGK